MSYTIAEAAKKSGISAYTLRYYDKEGLFPFLERTYSGTRKFKESDFEWLAVIACLKDTGMPVKGIRNYIDLCLKGDKTLKERLNLFIEQKKSAEAYMEKLKKHLDKIDHKIDYYITAINADTEKVHKKNLFRMTKEKYLK
ncbi:MAG: MerR family transcriptional regulator [Campylobacteraceae bacterium]|jgi:DNA-binding transcriptional MerR regulator|nr:MerR family transcriptional regulator [Campylobacteraceae bacterium]